MNAPRTPPVRGPSVLLWSIGPASRDTASRAVARGYLLLWRTWSACRSAGTGAPAPQPGRSGRPTIDISLGRWRFLPVVAALICGGVVLESWSHPGRVAAVPRGNWQRMARCLRLERHLAELGPAASEPQPTTVRRDGGSADRVGARVPRRTPTDLSHAVRRQSEQVSTADAMGRT